MKKKLMLIGASLCLSLIFILYPQNIDAQQCGLPMSLSSGCEAPGNDCIRWVTIPDNIQCPGGAIGD